MVKSIVVKAKGNVVTFHFAEKCTTVNCSSTQMDPEDVNPATLLLENCPVSIKNRPRLAIIHDMWAQPRSTGMSERIYNVAKQLALGDVFEVVLIVVDRGMDQASRAMLSTEPFQVHFVHADLVYRHDTYLQDLLRKLQVDVLQVKDSFMVACFARKVCNALDIPLVYELHDSKWTLFTSMGAAPDQIIKSTAQQVAAAAVSDLVVFTNDPDLDSLLNVGARIQRHVLSPNGVDCQELLDSHPDPASRQVVFVGHGFYEPNRRAIERLLHEILPGLLLKEPRASLLIAGRCPEDLMEQAQGLPVTFTGWVDSLSTVFNRGSIAVAPLLEGAGVKLKVLNYLAGGIPTVTTHCGISGLDPCDSVLIEDDIGKFADRILDLWRDPNRWMSMSQGGRAYVQRYDWNKIVRPLEAEYLRLLKDRTSITDNSDLELNPELFAEVSLDTGVELLVDPPWWKFTKLTGNNPQGYFHDVSGGKHGP